MKTRKFPKKIRKRGNRSLEVQVARLMQMSKTSGSFSNFSNGGKFGSSTGQIFTTLASIIQRNILRNL